MVPAVNPPLTAGKMVQVTVFNVVFTDVCTETEYDGLAPLEEAIFIAAEYPVKEKADPSAFLGNTTNSYVSPE